MAAQSWLWKYFNKLSKSKIQCNICNEIYSNTNLQLLSAHLYRSHNIINQKSLLKWNNDNHLIWQYFSKKDLFTAECKLCGYLFKSAYNKKNLEIHMIRKHSQLIVAIREEITCTWVSPHFTFDTNDCSTNCIHCDYNIKIFYGVEVLKNHLNNDHYTIIYEGSGFRIQDFMEKLKIIQMQRYNNLTEGNNVAISSQNNNMGINRRGI